MADPVIGERRTFDGQLGEWDGKGWKAVAADASAPRPRTWTDTAVDTLPMLGGAAGGLIGGAGGTVAGMGVGGVPGAIGGAAVGGAGGEAAKQLINRVRGVNVPTTPTEAAGDIATSGAVQGALEGAGQAIPPLLKAGGTAAYRGYLKPSLSRVNLPKAAEVVQTAIQEGIAMTKGGLEHTQQLIGELNGKVNDLLSQATGKTVDLHEIADGVRAFAQRRFNRPGNNPADMEAAMKVADRIDNHPSMAPTPPNARVDTVDMPTANTIKGDLQTPVADKFGVPGGTATTRTEKYASAAMRNGIEKQVPDVGPLNMQESKLIDLARQLQQSVERDANTQKIYGARALTGLALGGVSGYAGSSRNPYAGVVSALAGSIGLQPAVATRAAILAVKMGEKVPGAAVADVARAAVQSTIEAMGGPQQATDAVKGSLQSKPD